MANWAAIGALGTAAEGAGNYFGQVHMERKKAERLAQVRAEKLADVKDNRAHTASLLEDSNERADGLLEDKKEYDADILGDKHDREDFVYERGQDDKSDLRAETRFFDRLDEDEQRAWDRMTLEEQRDYKIKREAADLKIDNEQWSGQFWTADSGPDAGRIYKVLKDGSKVETPFEEMTDGERYESKVYMDAKAAKLKAAGEGLDLTESQSKVMIHFGNGAAAINDMNKALHLSSGDAAGTKQSLIRQIGQSGVTTTWLESEEAQLYNQAAYVALEATLRHKSGAALKVEEIILEAKKYQIEVGNTPAMIAQKIESLHRAVYLMGDTLPQGARDMALNRMSGTNYTNPEEREVIMNPTILGAGGEELPNFGGNSTSKAGNISKTIPPNETVDQRMEREFGG
jgi:hypothetical protein|tara:strand:- start:348 stop:1550 length:1203 start_codon:yes stop_codon:yes gene_type:complete